MSFHSDFAKDQGETVPKESHTIFFPLKHGISMAYFLSLRLIYFLIIWFHKQRLWEFLFLSVTEYKVLFAQAPFVMEYVSLGISPIITQITNCVFLF